MEHKENLILSIYLVQLGLIKLKRGQQFDIISISSRTCHNCKQTMKLVTELTCNVYDMLTILSRQIMIQTGRGVFWLANKGLIQDMLRIPIFCPEEKIGTWKFFSLNLQ